MHSSEEPSIQQIHQTLSVRALELYTAKNTLLNLKQTIKLETQFFCVFCALYKEYIQDM